MRTCDVQGHRGARGLAPENTLPGFERALDLMVTTLEGDLHLTKDGHPILSHDAALSDATVRLPGKADVPEPKQRPRLSDLTLAQTRAYVADRNPEPARFPKQQNDVTPVAKAFAEGRGLQPYHLPSLADLFVFVAAYAGEVGAKAGKTAAQRDRARQVRFSLELKRVPYRTAAIGDTFDGTEPGTLEKRFVEVVQQAGVAGRVTVQSFDHRAVKAVRGLDNKIQGAVLVRGVVPADPAQLCAAADAQVFSPELEFVDAALVRQVRAAKLKVIPWTINDPDDMKRLLDWEVDGIITDFPERLIAVLQARHIGY